MRPENKYTKQHTLVVSLVAGPGKTAVGRGLKLGCRFRKKITKTRVKLGFFRVAGRPEQ
jgi:hypothetical protein